MDLHAQDTRSVWRDGGRGQTIRWAVSDTVLGPMLIAASARGVCTLAFGADAALLAKRFPNAVVTGESDLGGLATKAAAAIATPAQPHDVPIDVGGSTFQRAVWRALGEVRAGTSVSYAELASLAGKPGAARAAGSACGANPVAVLVPCHRARRGDGSAGGYAWGLERKAELRRREGAALLKEPATWALREHDGGGTIIIGVREDAT